MPQREHGVDLQPLVDYHIETVRASVAASPPPSVAYCMALNPVTERSSTSRDLYAYGLDVDRRPLIEQDDQISAWNAGLFDDYFDAVRDPPADEPAVRRKLYDADFGAFDYWLITEVARRLNHDGFPPALATDDLVFYCMENDLSDAFEPALAYTTRE